MGMVGPPRNKGPSEGGVVTQVPVIQEVSLEKVREVVCFLPGQRHFGLEALGTW